MQCLHQKLRPPDRHARTHAREARLPVRTVHEYDLGTRVELYMDMHMYSTVGRSVRPLTPGRYASPLLYKDGAVFPRPGLAGVPHVQHMGTMNVSWARPASPPSGMAMVGQPGGASPLLYQLGIRPPQTLATEAYSPTTVGMPKGYPVQYAVQAERPAGPENIRMRVSRETSAG